MRSRLYIIAILLITIFINSPLPAQAAGFPVALSEMLEATSKLKSYEQNAKIGINMTVVNGSVTDTLNYTINATGKVIQGKSPSYSFLFDVLVNGVVDNERFTLDTAIDSIFLKNTLYLSLKRLTLAADEFSNYEMSIINEQLKDVKNVWIKIKLAELMEYTSADTLASLGSTDDSEALIAGIKAMEQMNIITFTRQSQESTINGKLTRRYIATFNKANLLALTEPTLTAAEKAEFQEIFSTINISSFDVWVDEATMLPMKFSGNLTLTNLKLDYNERANVVISIESTLGKINSVKKIKAPKKTKSLDQLMGSILGASIEANVKASDASIKANASGLRVVAELYYDANYNSYKNLCTSSNVAGYFDDISSVSGSKPQCNVSSNGQSYAISSKLQSGYFCVDSTGAAVARSSSLTKGATSCN